MKYCETEVLSAVLFVAAFAALVSFILRVT